MTEIDCEDQEEHFYMQYNSQNKLNLLLINCGCKDHMEIIPCFMAYFTSSTIELISSFSKIFFL
jgi:hypothetical protein